MVSLIKKVQEKLIRRHFYIYRTGSFDFKVINMWLLATIRTYNNIKDLINMEEFGDILRENRKCN